MTDHDIEPTKVDMLLSEINRTGKSTYCGALKPLSIRLPIQTYAKIVAIENFIGTEKTSKNKIIRLIGILFRIRSAKNIIPARLKKVINKLNLSQKYSL